MAKSNIDKLMELKELYEQGILTKEEMEVEKQRILNSGSSIVGEKSLEKCNKPSPPEDDIGNKSIFQKKKWYLFGGLCLIIVTLCLLFFLNIKETSIEKVPLGTVEIDSIPFGDMYANGINIKELFEAIQEKNSRKLKSILTKKGFVTDGKKDDYISEIWKKKVYNSGKNDSDTISVYLTSLTGFVGCEVDLVITCKEDEIMNEWVSGIKELGYSIVEDYKEKGYKCLSFSKENERGGLLKYDSPSREKTIEIQTNFDPKNEGLEGKTDTRADNEIDDAYDYNFVGKIKENGDQYSFKMALNIDGVGNASGYYIVTNGANERVLLKGSLTNWADGEGKIKLLEIDETGNNSTGYYFQGVLRLKYTDRGTYAGYSMSGVYKSNNISWPFIAECS